MAKLTGVDRADLVVRDPGEEDFTSALHDSTGDVHIPKLPPSNRTSPRSLLTPLKVLPAALATPSKPTATYM
jgi:hypothetical protein